MKHAALNRKQENARLRAAAGTGREITEGEYRRHGGVAYRSGYLASTPAAPATGPLVTKTGKVLTDDDIQALADEAEQGYDVEHLKPASGDTPHQAHDAVAPDFGDELAQLGIVKLRKLSKGRFSGGYAMKKPALIEALIESGITREDIQ